MKFFVLLCAFAASACALTSPPRTAYVSYLGGSYGESVAGIAVDSSGSEYIAGTTNSPDFPLTSITLGSPSATNTCAFVTKFNPSGSGILFSVGVANSRAHAFALDASGNMYLAIERFQPFFTSTAVLKLDPSGQKILFTKLIDALPESMTVDAAGNTYLAGSTANTLAATQGTYQAQLTPGVCRAGAGVQMIEVPCPDVFVIKLRPTGEVAWATYLGGSGPDAAHAIAVDGAGNPWIAGETVSTDFPVTAGAFGTAFHGEVDLGPLRYGDAFVAKLDPTGGKLLYSTYLGGSAPDGAFAIAVDAAGSAYVTGGTQSANFPTTAGALQTTYMGLGLQIPSLVGNAFVVKFDASGKVVYSTLLGGPNSRGTAITLTTTGQAVVNAASPAPACVPPAVTVLNTDGSTVVATSPVSGSHLAMDQNGALYSGGSTQKLLFLSTPHAYQTQYAGGDSDAYAAKVDFTQPAGPTVSSVVNAASLVLSGAVAPGEIVTIFGDSFGTQTQLDFSGMPATVLYTSNCQINAVVPPGVRSEVSTFLSVQTGAQTFGPVRLPVAPGLPGVFTLDGSGRGQAAVVNQDGTINSAFNPAPRGSIVEVYLTGAEFLVTASIGSAPADVVFAGQAPGLIAGVQQVNLKIPQSAPVGPSVPITIYAAGYPSQPVFIAVQ